MSATTCNCQINFINERSDGQLIETAPIRLSGGETKPYDFSAKGPVVRLHFELPLNSQSKDKIEFIDESGHVTSSTSLGMPLSALWSGLLPSKGLLHFSSSGKGLDNSIVVDRVIVPASPSYPAGIVGDDYRTWVTADSDKVREQGKAVARLYIVDDSNVAWTCTGFLISPGLLITNAHCFHSGTSLKSAVVEFDFDSYQQTPISRYLMRQVIMDTNLDLAAFELDEILCDRNPLALATFRPEIRTSLALIGHPDGEPKQVSKTGCRVTRVDLPGASAARTDFEHRCASRPGSSGSPVIDLDTGLVVGLHHYGEEASRHELLNQAVFIDLVSKALQGEQLGARACSKP
jgi:hypothetical protein